MATTIVFANQKGGVGKTSMCLHTAGALVKAGNRVLVVDLDQQGNLSSVFAKNIHALKQTVADVLLNGAKTIDVIQKTPIENLDLLPANLSEEPPLRDGSNLQNTNWIDLRGARQGFRESLSGSSTTIGTPAVAIVRVVR